ncbi:hypothetical protein QEO74_gp01 [Arthrobacter phage Nandita]|uniref:Uncharacterized protein n=1 Tax=Arthrobacter phage Nandita TaxID=2419963 RepID=A0A3G2KI28_9CAUD|nr:hypothetical protein QEO74_gp01 [Arthrobacter phage Nandita]AYN58624.1 hypothetical protein PBI_NANDITA_1 [Arthrobacter phage Nandita]
MAATLGTMTAKVLIQIGDGEPIEVGVMDIDLVPQQEPVMRGGDVHFNITAELDAEATARRVANRLETVGMPL